MVRLFMSDIEQSHGLTFVVEEGSWELPTPVNRNEMLPSWEEIAREARYFKGLPLAVRREMPFHQRKALADYLAWLKGFEREIGRTF